MARPRMTCPIAISDYQRCHPIMLTGMLRQNSAVAVELPIRAEFSRKDCLPTHCARYELGRLLPSLAPTRPYQSDSFVSPLLPMFLGG